MVCDKESLHPFKKERGIRPLTVKLGIAFRSDMSPKEIFLVCKINKVMKSGERGIRHLTVNWEIKNPLRHVIKGNIPRVQN